MAAERRKVVDRRRAPRRASDCRKDMWIKVWHEGLRVAGATAISIAAMVFGYTQVNTDNVKVLANHQEIRQAGEERKLRDAEERTRELEKRLEELTKGEKK